MERYKKFTTPENIGLTKIGDKLSETRDYINSLSAIHSEPVMLCLTFILICHEI